MRDVLRDDADGCGGADKLGELIATYVATRLMPSFYGLAAYGPPDGVCPPTQAFESAACAAFESGVKRWLPLRAAPVSSRETRKRAAAPAAAASGSGSPRGSPSKRKR